MAYYDPKTDTIVCKAENGSLIAYPAYSAQELITMGKKLLAGKR